MKVQRRFIVTLGSTAAVALLTGLPVGALAVDLTGVWQATSPRSAGGANRPPLTAQAQADLDAYDALDDPVIRCVPPGFPRSGLIIYPFQIVQTDELILFLYETFGMVRRIYMDGREAPAYLPAERSGYSTGHWDGKDLVVQTTNVASGLLNGGGVFQYGDVEVVERYRLANDGDVLEADVTITAPQTLQGPWSRSFTWELDREGMIFEWGCDPSDSRF